MFITRISYFLVVIYITNISCQDQNPRQSTMHIHFLLLTNQSMMELNNRTIYLVNPNEKTVVLLYGWLTSLATDQNVITLARKYRDENDYNVIYIDWSTASYENYLDEVLTVIHRLGTKIGEMIMYLHESGVNLKKVHLIGFSLGAHALGVASRFVRSHHPLNQTIGRISGLDPAGPLFTFPFSDESRLHSDDADIVDVTHTSSNLLGIGNRLGTIDYYVNGGIIQPSCGVIVPNNFISMFTVNGCSHVFAVVLFQLSLNNKHYRASSHSTQCKDVIIYGNEFDGKAKGIYYIQTNNIAPYRTKC